MNTTVIDSFPRPDLSARRVVIIGGTGRVGEGIVSAWLRDGAEVVVPTRAESRGAELREYLADVDSQRLHLAIGEYTSFATAQAMAESITSQYGPVTDVIASIGGWWQGKPLWEVTEDEWQHFNQDLSTAHVANIRAWLPILPSTGSYHLILGGSASKPVPGSSIISMEQAGLLMMHRVLTAEAGDQRRVFAHELGPVATRQRPFIDPDWVSNQELGLVSETLAANPGMASEHFLLRGKHHVRQVLEQATAGTTRS
ncbi:NAD(P)-dependent dehydrogenase (short-subunit alcohol dehydrogenase family) [Glutamicibacter mysorens]|uniref:NAD(P)-dependent dehydrogenase (Short-subunit alcohol dehydrogenase family) n=1 Tax=Glutamicibacter mysorens TaxID=257984 RepID=A0ABX4N5G8_9MICC|nr:SDR family oxidoreductase [Glutamicibacter mysorens]PJJ45709.1 NAD(P)-dependent dehydrogenase (short-subunit alcohol dehydrogenase family) [Glutamicibacter mysorens]